MEVTKSNSVVLSLGSNLGDRRQNLISAVDLINFEIGDVKEISPLFETPPWEMITSNQFYNICILIETNLNPEALLLKTQHIEKKLGRDNKTANGYASRTIDIDIIFYDNIVHNSETLTIPHPKYRLRKFVLEPITFFSNINEIRDPESFETIKELIKKCPDVSFLKLLGNLYR